MAEPPSQERYWVSVFYRCCHVYQRVYFSQGAQEAQGRCPRCLGEVNFRITEDGDHARFFATEE